MSKPKVQRCKRCRKGGVSFAGRSIPGDGRPKFHCARCGYSFTSGRDGKPYDVLIPKELTT